MITDISPVAATFAAPIYQVKITLAGSKPPIWRRLHVPGSANLGWLHAVLQVVMGWTNSHLHQFITGEACYSEPGLKEDEDINDEPDRDERKTVLMHIASRPGVQFGYEYDFGDSWEHEITVEKILPPDLAVRTVALCLDGARACPPEDCGGIWGYTDLLKILKNRRHPEHKEMSAWIGGSFNAESFEVAKVNLWLRKLKWPRVTEAQLRKVLMGRDHYHED